MVLAPLIAGGAALLLLVAASRRKKPAPAPPKKKPAAGSDDGSGALGAGAGAAATALGAGGAMAAAGAGYVAANAYLGGQLTGDAAGVAAGGVGGVYGNAFNAGRVVGKEFDQAVGGSGTGLTGTTAQVGAGTASLAWAYFGWAAGVSLGIVTAFFYALFVVISDLNRLAFGQKGARDDYEKHWAEAEKKFFDALSSYGKDPVTLKTFTDDDHVRRFSWPLADGYMRMANRLAYRAAMRMPRGVGIVEAEHARFYAERGYYVGRYGGAGPNAFERPGDEPLAKCWTADYLGFLAKQPAGTSIVTFQVPVAWTWHAVRRPIPFPELPESDEMNTASQPPAWAQVALAELEAGQQPLSATQAGTLAPKYVQNPENPLQTVTVADYWEVTVSPVMGTQSGYSDTLGIEIMQGGRRRANVEAWATWHTETHGSFVGDVDHAKKGFERGHFEGEVLDVGGVPYLAFDGRTFNMKGERVA